MLKDFFQWTDKGIYCPYGKFYLDAKVSVEHCIVSHAHADHAVKNHQNVYCTAATKALMQCRYKAFAGENFQVYNYHQSFKLNGILITFFSAGHILGSSQVLLEYNNVRYLYTGDFKTVEDGSCEAFESVETDVLLTESTFANPEFIHPIAEIEIQKLNTLNGNIMLGAYSLGKSQRLTHLIQQHCPEKQVLLHHSMYPFHLVYKNFGFDLGVYQLYSRKLIKSQKHSQVYMVPPITFGNYYRAHRIHRVFATGWHKQHRGNDLALHISDHADWNELIRYIVQTKAKQIVTTHGDGRHLMNYFKDEIEVAELYSLIF